MQQRLALRPIIGPRTREYERATDDEAVVARKLRPCSGGNVDG